MLGDEMEASEWKPVQGECPADALGESVEPPVATLVPE